MKSIVMLLSLFCHCQWTKGQVANAHGCPKDWIRNTDRCYYVSGKEDTFDRANKYCKDRKAQLAPALTCEAHMNLVETLEFYRAKCPKGQICDEFWMGIKDLTYTNWKTGNDVIIEKTSGCQQWAAGYPRQTGSCGIMSLRGSLMRGVWKNKNCTNQYKYVCITCPNNYNYIPEVNGCFYLNLMLANWNDAQKNCGKMKRGAQLMTIYDSAKQEAVEKYMQLQLARKESEICFLQDWPQGGKVMFLGGQTTNPDECNTPYVWKHSGAPDIPFIYTNWLAGVPNCSQKGENCLILTTSKEFDFRWEDAGCFYHLCSLCEF